MTEIKEKVNEKIIPIFYACDDNFIKYTIVSLRSMIDNASKDRRYKIHIMCADTSDNMREEVLKLVNENFKIVFVNVEGELKKIGKKLPLRDYYSKTTYFRLFIAEMYPEYDKAIYIDSDTVVLGDISELYDTDIGDCYVGACHEQAMLQNDIFGTYVEKVMGINRNNYFNAGLLLINCNQFRKNKVFEQFLNLLGIYNFVVTQDEDYLNVICYNKVYWLFDGWNTEVFGELSVEEKDIKIIHYIMVSKPWHYHDSRLSKYFWEYAIKTSVCDLIKEVLKNFTEAQKQKDVASAIRLEQLAIQETNREDNYLNRINGVNNNAKAVRS